MVAETSGDAVVYKYVRGAGLLYAENATDEKTWYVKDAHGDTVQLTDGNGNIVWNYAYDAFGNQKETVNSGTEPYNPFRYTGEYFDAETGFIYLRARYMDPQIGRFISEDPVGDGVNWYVYAAGNPVRYYDPSGLAVTAWDEQHLTKSELEALEQYTKDWNDANKVGDEYGMYRAHANAEDIRRKYRDLNEITLDNGLTGTVSLDEDYSRIFTYIERKKVSKPNENLSFGDAVFAMVLFPVVALSSCGHTDMKEFEKQLKMSGNYTGTSGLPSNVVNSFQQYEAHGWINHAGQTPGTKAGKSWGNSGSILPTYDMYGYPITYQEFDVNNRIPGQPRDAERFVVGSDGSVYYTDDHYRSFKRVK